MSTTTPLGADDPDDLHVIAAEQRQELLKASAADSDFDFAFRLQLQEAIDASLSLHPSTSSPPPAPPSNPVTSSPSKDDDLLKFTDLQSEELLKFEEEHNDRLLSESEYKRLQDDLSRRIHDQRVAREIQRMSEDYWEEYGDNFEVPYGEGSSKGVVSNETFRVYFKGLLEKNTKPSVVFGGIGVAICDSRDGLLLELKKPLDGNGLSRRVMEIKALIEGLNAAIDLDLQRVVFYCDYYPIFQFITGRWSVKQRKVMTLIDQVTLLRRRFKYCKPSLVARKDIKFAFKLAREAIDSQMNRPAESSQLRNQYETCVICLEDTDAGQIFIVDGCLHRYCCACMKQHVEVKLLYGMLPKCPHEGCNSDLRIDICGKFLTPKLIEMMNQRIIEASIPAAEKVYCPRPKCSALMSKSQVLEYSRVLTRSERSGARRCIKCNHDFCINCKVPWHNNMSCFDYKKRNPFPPLEDLKLKNLAARNLWRQCVKCNHMIELAAGCYHITCRCGYEFCYTCGAEWKDKQQTCSCPLFEYSDDDDFDEEDEDEEYDDDEDEYTDDENYEYFDPESNEMYQV